MCKFVGPVPARPRAASPRGAGGLSVLAGSSYDYQRWNRDPPGGGVSASLSDGYEIVHTP